jgi:DNA polymerase III delta prime subunit
MAKSDQDNRYRPSEGDNRRKHALAHIRGLVGATEFKAWVEALEHIRPQLVAWRTAPHFPMTHLLFAIDPGNGLTTTLDALHAYLAAAGLFPGDEDGFTPLHHATLRMAYSEHLTHNRREAYDLVKMDIEDDKPGLFAIDLTDWVDRFDDVWFQRLLDQCVRHTPANRYVFVVPLLDDPALDRIRQRLADRLPVDLIRFPQPDPALLFSLLRSRMKGFGYHLPEEAGPLLQRWMFTLKGAGRYHGMRSLDNLADELALTQIAAHPERDTQNRLESMNLDVIQSVISPSAPRDAMSARERLDAMVGMDPLKRQLLEIVQAARMARTLSQHSGAGETPCLHMMFTGNPGTGKTELARIAGQLFREGGLLPNGELLEVNRFDLVGQYVGQTGPKTISVCRSAYGSILFIDEAYLLSLGEDTVMGKDFGREAIGALIAEMENNRERLIVILAGYQEEMDRFLRVNPGLAARIPYRLHFPSYDRDSLADIFLSMLSRQGTPTAVFGDLARNWFKSLPEERLNNPHFGNARFARNLAERVQLKAMLRQAAQTQEQSVSAGPLTFEPADFTLATADPDILRVESSEKRAIGY